MVARLREMGLEDPRVLDAMGRVERHRLVPEALRHRAYDDTPLPIGHGQTISAPGVVARMTAALGLGPRSRVLEVGTGSAYQCAVLARLCEHVVSIERVPALTSRARSALDSLGVTNAIVHLGDGSRGRPTDGPFDGIVVTASGPAVPEPLLRQLAPGGRLVGPFGSRGDQRLICVERTGSGAFEQRGLGPCRFVDLLGAHGWDG